MVSVQIKPLHIDPFGYELDSTRINSLLYDNTLCLSDFLFRPSDIKKFESEHPEFVTERIDEIKLNKDKDKIKDSEQHKSIHIDQGLHEPQNVFWHIGDFWEVRFNGEKTTLRDLSRLRYIVCLLAKPNKVYKVSDLEDIVNKVNILSGYEKEISEKYSLMEPEDFQEYYDLTIGELSSATLTSIELDRLREMATEIWGDLRAAEENNTNIEPAQKRWEECKKHLFNEHGIVAFIGKKETSYICDKRTSY